MANCSLGVWLLTDCSLVNCSLINLSLVDCLLVDRLLTDCSPANCTLADCLLTDWLPNPKGLSSFTKPLSCVSSDTDVQTTRSSVTLLSVVGTTV